MPVQDNSTDRTTGNKGQLQCLYKENTTLKMRELRHYNYDGKTPVSTRQL